jgi:hypothetical protein
MKYFFAANLIIFGESPDLSNLLVSDCSWTSDASEVHELFDDAKSHKIKGHITTTSSFRACLWSRWHTNPLLKRGDSFCQGHSKKRGQIESSIFLSIDD